MSASKKARDALIIAYYKRGCTLRLIADVLGMRMQRVHQIIVRDAPEILRPSGYRLRVLPPEPL